MTGTRPYYEPVEPDHAADQLLDRIETDVREAVALGAELPLRVRLARLLPGAVAAPAVSGASAGRGRRSARVKR